MKLTLYHSIILRRDLFHLISDIITKCDLTEKRQMILQLQFMIATNMLKYKAIKI